MHEESEVEKDCNNVRKAVQARVYARSIKRMPETKDLILKQAEQDDWYDMYHNLWCHDESAKYMLWEPTHSEEAAKLRTSKSVAYQIANPHRYFVHEKKSGQAIGFAGMMKIADDTFEDTGVAIGPAFTGQGYGKQILMALVEEAFHEPDITRFVASCRSQNEASRRLQLSCGFTYSHSEDRVDPRTEEGYVLEFYELYK